MPLVNLIGKSRLYAQEFRFALTAPVTLTEKCSLLKETARFHWRNWTKAALPAGAGLQTFDLNLGGYRTLVYIRPEAGDMSIFQEVFARQSYHVDDAILDPKTVSAVFDLGANAGYASLAFAARYPNARIISVEPNPENFALLCKNTAAEPRIVPVQACVTAVPMEDAYISGSGPAWSYQMNSSGRGTKVAGLTITDLMKANAIAHIDFLKIDVEGAEREIFAKGDFLPNANIVCAEIHGDYDLAAFNRDLAPWGFSARINPPGLDPQLMLATRNRQ